MQAEIVRLDAAVQLGDAEQTAKSLDYIREHRTDAPRTYQQALVLVHQSDTAADWLIELLEDRDQRAAALLSVQDFASLPKTLRQAELGSVRRAIVARPDVQEVIQKVGRIEKYNVGAP